MFELFKKLNSQELSLVNFSFRIDARNEQKTKMPATDDVINVNYNLSEARHLLTNKYKKYLKHISTPFITR